MDDIQHITSRDNSKVKLAKSVRDGREAELIFIEGVRLVEEAVRSDLTFREAFISGELLENDRVHSIIDNLRTAGTNLYVIDNKIAEVLSDTKNGQGIVVLAERPARHGLEHLIPVEGAGVPIVVFLEKVNNPANLGAVIRTAEAAGVAGLIISEGSADPFSPKSLRAAMGPAFRLRIVNKIRFEDVMSWAKSTGLISTGADISATNGHMRTEWRKPRLLVLGSEAHGLDHAMIETLDELTMIEMENNVESLNLAVACGVILFEAKRQNVYQRSSP
jgi:TrmH family RNA methyltransferase